MKIQPHDRFSRKYLLTPEVVSEQAIAVGDTNPIHHDAAIAAKSRYGRRIVSGTHTTALLLALSASYFSKGMSMVGLEYFIKFRRPIYADEMISLEWLIIKVTRNNRLSGDIVDLRGRIVGEDGKTSLGAKGRLLVTANL